MRSTLPRPSFRVLYEVVPLTSSWTTKTGIEELTTPAIGPTARRLWQGAKGTEGPSFSASSKVACEAFVHHRADERAAQRA